MSIESTPVSTAVPFSEAYRQVHSTGWHGMGIAAGDQLSLTCAAKETRPLEAEEFEELQQSVPESTVDTREVNGNQWVTYQGSSTRDLATVMRFLITHSGPKQS